MKPITANIRLFKLSAIVMALTLAPVASGATFVWSNADSDGAWPEAANWTTPPVFAADAVLDFTSLDITVNYQMYMDADSTAGSLLFADIDASHNWTLEPGYGATLTLATTAGSPVIGVTNQSATINTVLSGNQGFEKTGAGTLVLTKTNQLTGPLVFSNGVVSVASEAMLGVAPGSPTPGSLAFNGGTLKLTALGTIHVNRGISVSAAGGTFDTSGLSDTTNNSVILPGAITGNGPLTLRSHGDLSAAGNFSNTLLSVNNAANATFSGGFNISHGIVSFPDQASAGTGPLNFSEGGGLVATVNTVLPNPVSIDSTGGIVRVYGPQTLELTGPLTGSGIVRKTDTGTLLLSGTLTGFTGTINNLLGTTRVQSAIGGILQVTAGTIQLENTVTASEVLILGGTLQIPGTYGGSIAYSAGSLVLPPSGVITGDLTVQTGSASLEARGMIQGDLAVQGTVTAATIGQALVAGDLITGTDASSNVTLRPVTQAPEIAGALIVNGNLDLVIDGTIPSGSAIIKYGALVTDTPGNPAAHISVSAPSSITITNVTILPTEILVTYTTEITWDINATAGIQGGAGTWSTTDPNWTSNGGTTNQGWNNTTDVATTGNFTLERGLVTVSEPINLAGIVVKSTSHTSIGGLANTGYVFQGAGALNFGTQNGLLDAATASANAQQFDNPLTGTGGLTVKAGGGASGAGRLVLIGDNTGLSGGITVNSGLLAFASQSALGSNSITFNGTAGVISNVNYVNTGATGRTDGSSDLTLTNAIALNGVPTSPHIFRIWGGRNLRLNGPITGPGKLRLLDTGFLHLSGNNDYSGGTLISLSQITATSNTAFGTSPVSVVQTTSSTTTTRVNLVGATVANDFILDTNARTGVLGAITAQGGSRSTINGSVTIMRAVGNGGHFASDGAGSILRLMGPIYQSGAGAIPNAYLGTIELGGGGTYPDFISGQGTLRIVANNGINPTANLRLSATSSSTLDLNGFNQTLARIGRVAPDYSAGTEYATSVTNTAATPSILTLDGADFFTFSGAIANGTGGISLVKKGNNTVTLSEANTYAGDTKVEAGTLVLSQPALNDNSAVRLLTGAVLELSHGADDTVDKLFIDGIQQAAGTYHAGNSGFIAGTGKLLVTSNPSTDSAYDSWLTAAGLTPGAPNTGAGEDYDHSGALNLVEFALGGDPKNPATDGIRKLFTTDAAGDDNLVLTIAVRTGATFSGTPNPTASFDGITYTIQGGTTLAAWTEAVEPVATQNGGTLIAPSGYELRSFRLVQAPALGSEGFLRVQVTQP